MSTISAGTTNSTALVETGDTTGNLIIQANTSTTVGTFSSTGLAVVGSLSATSGFNGTVGATTPSTGAFTTVSASNGAGSRAISVLGGSIASFYDSSAGEQGRIQASTSALFLSTVTTNPININVNSTTVGTFNAYGLGIGSGVPSSGMGITFPATQSASTDANTLDDYEEGTWTPSIGGTATYTTQSGNYVKVGRLVFASASLQINAIGTGSTTTITGLPFTNGASGECSATVGYFVDSLISLSSITGYVGSSNTNIVLQSFVAGGAVSTTSNAVLKSSTQIRIQAVYYSNS